MTCHNAMKRRERLRQAKTMRKRCWRDVGETKVRRQAEQALCRLARLGVKQMDLQDGWIRAGHRASWTGWVLSIDHLPYIHDQSRWE